MFNPSQTEVREFFCSTWRKYQDQRPLTPMETIAGQWIAEHPEYHAELASPDAIHADYSVEAGKSNPFLHLSMHLAIAEQLSINQPPGIVTAYQTLRDRLGEDHAAHHHVMECLGQILWESQRNNLPPDSDKYLDMIRRQL